MAAEGPPARALAPPPEYRLMAADPRPKSTTRAMKLRVVKNREDRKPKGPLGALFLLGSCRQTPALMTTFQFRRHAVVCCVMLNHVDTMEGLVLLCYEVLCNPTQSHFIAGEWELPTGSHADVALDGNRVQQAQHANMKAVRTVSRSADTQM